MPATSLRLLWFAVGSLGASAFATQVALMREFLGCFAGNELVFGIVLGSWMLLTGLGAAWARHSPRLANPLAVFLAGQMLVALWPIAAVFALRALWNVVFVRGAAAGVTETVLNSLVLLAPYCLAAGYLLTLACLLCGEHRGGESLAAVYFCDCIGGVAGGVAVSCALACWLDHFTILYLAAVLNLAAVGLLAARQGRRRWLIAAAAAALALAALVATANLDRLSTAWQYSGQDVVYRGNSPYGRLVVTRSAGQYNFIENGLVLFSTGNVAAVEETVHYAMAQRPDARRVLLLGGGISGTAREILKYGAERVDYVELDPLILRVAGQLGLDTLADRRIHVIETDGRRFIKQPGDLYDVVIVDVPEPSTFQLNRFYTLEFMREAARRLRPGGVLCFPLGTYDDYVGPQQAKVLSTVYRTLREAFAGVLMIPGQRIFFLASDGDLTTAVAARIEAHGIHTRLLDRNYLKVVLRGDRLADLRRAVDGQAPPNRDFNPVLYYYHLLYWITQFKVRFGLFEGGLLLILAVYLLRIRPVPLAVFSTGFAASALEVILLMGFQIVYGSTYQQLSLIVTMFMIGLAIGSYLMRRWLPRRTRRDLAWLQLAIAAFALCVPAALWSLGRLDQLSSGSVLVWMIIPLLTAGLAVLVGMEFPLGGRLDFGGPASTASRIYTADYVGAALGALLVSTLLIPLLGIAGAACLTAGLNILSGMVLLATGGNGK
jgi:spermidine synthase